MSPTELQDQEMDTNNTDDAGSNEKDFYKSNDPANNSKASLIITGLKTTKGNKKMLALVGIGGGGGLIIILIIVLLLMSLLKVPNYAANIAAYRLARSAMDYAKTSADEDAAKISLEQTSDSVLADEASSTLNTLETYKPNDVYHNMDAENTIKYINDKEVLLDGKSIPIKDLSNYSDEEAFAQLIQPNVATGLRADTSLIRSPIAYNIRQFEGITDPFVAWPDSAQDYANLNNSAADELQYQQSFQDIHTTPTNDTTDTAFLNNDTTSLSQEITSCNGDPACEASFVTGKIPDQISKDLVNDAEHASQFSGGSSILGIIDPIEKFLIPACLIFDGSMAQSAPDINAQSDSASKSFYLLESAADQQKAGATNAQAVGAMNNKLGGGSSIPDQYMNNQPVNTAIEKSPQSSNMGTYTTLANLIPNQTTVNIINSIAPPVCKKLTSLTGIILTTLITWGAAFISDGGTDAAVETAATSMDELIAMNITETATSASIFSIIGNTITITTGFMSKFITSFIAIESATIGAKGLVELDMLLTLDKTGLANDGATSTNGNFKNQADMGADIQNNELERQMMYGEPLTDQHIASSDQASLAFMNKQESINQSVYDRYLALSNPSSLMSKISYQMASIRMIGFKGLMYNFLGKINFANIVNILSLGIFNKYALADTPDTSATNHYGIVQWGWTNQEYNLINSDASYGVLQNAHIVEQYKTQHPSDYSNMVNTYSPCFTDDMGTILASGLIVRNAAGDVIGGTCAAQNLDQGMVFRWRLYMERNNVLNQNLGIQNPINT